MKSRQVGSIAFFSSLFLLGSILVILLKQRGLSDLLGIWRRSDTTAIAAAIFVMLAVQMIAAIRLKVILVADHIERIRLSSVYRIQLISQFASHGAPVSALADIARAAMLKLRFNITMGRSIRLVLYDRVCGVLGAVAIGLVAALAQSFGQVPPVLLGAQFALWTSCAIAASALLLLGGTHFSTRFDLLNRVLRAAGMLGEMFASGTVAIKLSLISAAQIAGFAAVCQILAYGMHIDVAPGQVLAYMPLIFFVSSLPIFYLGWGAREAIFIATLGGVGAISAAQAIALSVGLGVVVFLASLPGAVFWLLRPSMRKRLAEEAGETNRFPDVEAA